MGTVTRVGRVLTAVTLLLMLSMAVVPSAGASAFKNVQVKILDQDRNPVDCGTFRIAPVDGNTAPLTLTVPEGKVEASIAPDLYLVAVQSCTLDADGNLLFNLQPAIITEEDVTILDSFWQVSEGRASDEIIIDGKGKIEFSQDSQDYPETFVLHDPPSDLVEAYGITPEGLAKAVLLVSGASDNPDDFSCVIERHPDGNPVNYRFPVGSHVAARDKGGNLVGYYEPGVPYTTQEGATKCTTHEGKFFEGSSEDKGTTERFVDNLCRNIIVPPHIPPPHLPPPPEVTPPPTPEETPPPSTETG